MDTVEFGRVFNGISLYMKGNYDGEKYHWKSRVPPKGMSKPFAAKLVHDEYQARIVALSCAYNKISWWQLANEHVKEGLEWVERINDPAKSIADLRQFKHITFQDLIKDSLTGAPLFTMLLAGQIHFITFAYVVFVTRCTKNWQTIYWKTQKEPILKILRALDIDTGNILQFASQLRKELQ